MDEDVGRTGSPATGGLRVLQPDDGDPVRGWEQGQTCYTCASPLVSYKEAKQWRNIEKEEESEGDLSNSCRCCWRRSFVPEEPMLL